VPTPTPTPIATPLVDFVAAVGEVLAELDGVVEDVVVVVEELLVLVLALLCVKVAEGLIVVTTVAACRVKTTLGSEQLHPSNP
jgi:hypothetical protein